MIDEHRAPEEADHKAGPAGDEDRQQGEHDRRHELVLVQPHQFRIAGEIGDLDQIRHIVLAGKNPAEMTVDEALMSWRVDVGLRIRMQVMMAMLGCPPQHAFLGRALRQDGERELERAAGPVGAMREVAVVAGTDGEDPQPVEEEAEYERVVGHAGPQGGDAREVHEDEGNGRRIHDVGMLDNRSGGLRCNRIAHGGSLKCADNHNRPMSLYSNLERPSLQLRLEAPIGISLWHSVNASMPPH